jgi:hypothetical protein
MQNVVTELTHREAVLGQKLELLGLCERHHVVGKDPGAAESRPEVLGRFRTAEAAAPPVALKHRSLPGPVG